MDTDTTGRKKNLWRMFCSTFLALLLLAFFLFPLQRTIAVPAVSNTLYVDGSTGNDTTNCQNSTSPCATVKYALEQATDGDTLRVAAGTYPEPLSIEKSLSLRGGYESLTWMRDIEKHSTTIDATGLNMSVIRLSPDIDVRIEGFIVTGGNTMYQGGGIVIDGATTVISATVIRDNKADGYGGGIWIAEMPGETSIPNTAEVTIVSSSIVNNSSNDEGGGIRGGPAKITIVDSKIEGNTTKNQGGGIRADNLALFRSEVNNNVASDQGGTRGGGIVVRGHLHIEDSIVSGNRAVSTGETIGGGIDGEHSNVSIVNTIVTGNAAQYNAGISFFHTNFNITNSLIVKNLGNGIAGNPITGTIMNSTISDNLRDIGLGGNITIRNSIIWNNGDDYSCRSGVCTLAYSNVDKGDVAGIGNISENPRFVDPSDGNYRLQPGSPSVDSGSLAGSPSNDLEGKTRPQGGGVDMGAYEVDVLPTGPSGAILTEETIPLLPGITRGTTADVPQEQSTVEFLTIWPGSTVNTTLTDPKGTVINPETATADPAIEHVKGSTFELYRIAEPMSGTWQIDLYGADLPDLGEVVTVRVSGFGRLVYLPLVQK